MSDSEEEEKPLSTKRVNVKKREYYNKTKSNVQRNRIIKSLIDLSNGDIESRKPSLKTLKKYGLYNETTLKIELPIEYKSPELNFVPLGEPPKELRQNIEIIPKPVGKVSSYNPNNKIISGKEIENYILTDYAKQEYKGKHRSQARLKSIARVPRELFILRKETYDENKQILPYFLDALTNINETKKYSWKVETQKNFIARLQQCIENYPPLIENVPKAILDIYDNFYKELSNDVELENNQKKKRPHFLFSVIRDQVAQTYTKNSFQYLVILMYHKIISRDNLQAEIRDWNDNRLLDPKVNYLMLDRADNKSKFILQEYKTSRQYKTDYIDLGPTITKLIIKLHPNNSSNLLFPTNLGKSIKANKIGDFIKTFLTQIPLFKAEDITLNYLRHSVISSAILDINAKYPEGKEKNEKMKELASLAKHTIALQQKKYIYPFKDADGKLITM